MKTIVGTPYYVAPEVLKGKYNYKCDVWSAGVIMFILLCGYPPFEGDNNKEIFMRVMKGQFSFDPEDWSCISSEAKDLIKMMLTYDQQKRCTIDEALKHPWFTITESLSKDKIDNNILNRLKKFRAPHKFQMEVLSFLVNNLSNMDFSKLRKTFAAIDVNNTGNLTL